MISFIDEHRGVFGVEPICRLLPIAPSTYYENVAKRVDVDRLSIHARSDIGLKIEIRRVVEQNYRVYGVRKVWRQLKREGFDVARCIVARLMRSTSLQGIIRGKPIRTTFPDKTAPSPPDRVNRQFKAHAPNRLWSRHFMIDVPLIAAASCITQIAAFNTCPFGIPSGWQRQASSHLSEAQVTLTTTPSPKRSTVFTRPRSSIGVDHGGASKRWNSLPWNGPTGSTIDDF